MRTIFVRVKCDLGKAYEVANSAVVNIEELSEVHSISGNYDLLMKCFLPAGADVGHFVTETLQLLPGVKDTYSIIAYKEFGRNPWWRRPGM